MNSIHKATVASFVLLLMATSLMAQDQASPKVPFSGMDLTWINGQSRQAEFPLVINGIVTGSVYVDGYFNYNFANPQDNTQTISGTTGRHKEFTLSLASFGFDANYKNALGRVLLQTGQFLETAHETDGSVLHGRNTGTDNLRYVREAAAGYHFNSLYGINVEMGLFTSYVGLESYLSYENWNYQRAMVSDFTPFFFTGARMQAFLSKKVKTELWLMNGWQSYSSWNETPAVGTSILYRPSENLQLIGNLYVGDDTRGMDVTRFHHDNSIVFRYLPKREAGGISQGAFSINTHYGFQSGDGIESGDNYMFGVSAANRFWFKQNKLALTVRGDYVTNPGLYMAFSPSPISDNDFNDAVNGPSGKDLEMVQGTLTFDIMPNDFVTFRIEYNHRSSNVPYFAGPGGTTSPDGFVDSGTEGWRPDLKKSEDRMIFALNFRM